MPFCACTTLMHAPQINRSLVSILTWFKLCQCKPHFIPTFVMRYNEPKVGITLLLISYLLPEYFVLASIRMLLLVSFLFVAVVIPFDSYSPLNF